jgi:hypothetical protein
MHRCFTFQECLQGEAAGFKLTSLERMMEIKSMTPNQSLLHYMIKMAQDDKIKKKEKYSKLKKKNK